MINPKIDVIASTISGSIQDWGKVKHIVPLFEKHGFTNVSLYTADSHAVVREKTQECLTAGTRIIISAGGSGTFNAALEGCCDSGIDLGDIWLGFLRKGSADLIGKVLGMPDEIDAAIQVFADAIKASSILPCDVIRAETENPNAIPRHFVGYGGAEIFGKIPTYTENRFIKYYKGVLGQLFGDMGPFFVGATLASIERTLKTPFKGKRKWQIHVDGELAAENTYQALILANGDLGKNMPLARDVPLGSGDFYLFGLRDLGLGKLFGQFKHTWDASVLEEPKKWGFDIFRIHETLKLAPTGKSDFHVNIDGSTIMCRNNLQCRISDQIQLIVNKDRATTQ